MRRDLMQQIWIGVSENKISLGFFAITYFAIAAVLATHGVSAIRPASILGYLILHLATLLLFLASFFLRQLWKERPESPIAMLLGMIRDPATQVHVARRLPLILALSLFMSAFSAMKSSIPLFVDYTWDAALIAADYRLHGGDPAAILHPVLGRPMITSALSISYHLWVLLIFSSGVWVAFFESSRIAREHFFVSYFAIWSFGGIVLAIVFASVGPCFVGPIFDNHRFDEHMDYLRDVSTVFPVMTLDVQGRLLEWYMEGSHGIGRGISAMPSMHVAMASLFYLAIRRVAPRTSIFFGAYVLIILLGSVHLGYHYAIDGYLAVLLAVFVWKVAAVFVSRWLPPTKGVEEGSGALPLPEVL